MVSHRHVWMWLRCFYWGEERVGWCCREIIAIERNMNEHKYKTPTPENNQSLLSAETDPIGRKWQNSGENYGSLKIITSRRGVAGECGVKKKKPHTNPLQSIHFCQCKRSSWIIKPHKCWYFDWSSPGQVNDPARNYSTTCCFPLKEFMRVWTWSYCSD